MRYMSTGIVYNGQLFTAHNSSCLGSYPSMFTSIPTDAIAPTSIMVGVYLTPSQAREYLAAFRRDYADGFTFMDKKGGKVIGKCPRPTVTYFHRTSASKRFNKEFLDICIAKCKSRDSGHTGPDGYFEINLPKGISEHQSFVLIKTLVKCVASPNAKAIGSGEKVIEALRELKSFNAAIMAASLAGAAGGYYWPIPYTPYQFYNKAALQAWIKGANTPFVNAPLSDPAYGGQHYGKDNMIGEPKQGKVLYGSNNQHGTSHQCLPNAIYDIQGVDQADRFNMREVYPTSVPSADVKAAINIIKRILEL